MKQIKVLVVPVTGSVFAQVIRDDIKSMQGLVTAPGASRPGLIERVTLSHRSEVRDSVPRRFGRTTLLHVNEEGIVEGLPINERLSQAFGWPLLGQPLHGQGFIAAVGGAGGTTYDDLIDAEIQAWTRMLCMLQDEGLHVVKP